MGAVVGVDHDPDVFYLWGEFVLDDDGIRGGGITRLGRGIDVPHWLAWVELGGEEETRAWVEVCRKQGVKRRWKVAPVVVRIVFAGKSDLPCVGQCFGDVGCLTDAAAVRDDDGDDCEDYQDDN